MGPAGGGGRRPVREILSLSLLVLDFPFYYLGQYKGLSMSVLGCFVVPVQRFLTVLVDAGAGLEHVTKMVLGFTVTIICQWLPDFHGRGAVTLDECHYAVVECACHNGARCQAENCCKYDALDIHIFSPVKMSV